MSQPQQTTHSTLDAQTFGALHRTYHHRLLSSVTGMVRDQQKAEEITAKAFQIGWEKRAQFRGDASPYTWLHAIARSQVWRSANGRAFLPLDALADAIAEPGNFVEALETQDAIDQLHRALERIPTVYRNVLISCYLNGETTHSFGERAGIPRGTVLSRMSTAKRLLRERLKTTP
jgi:RNA polymerase sigma-70 factor, ECF subfamily